MSIFDPQFIEMALLFLLVVGALVALIRGEKTLAVILSSLSGILSLRSLSKMTESERSERDEELENQDDRLEEKQEEAEEASEDLNADIDKFEAQLESLKNTEQTPTESDETIEDWVDGFYHPPPSDDY